MRRTWRGQSPFAADRGHLHHRLLEIGHSHSRAVLIMYFWSALIAFGALTYSVNSASMWIVLSVVILSTLGLVLLLLPRFTPRAPRWAEAFVPPRYRRGRAAAPEAPETAAEPGAEAAEGPLEAASGSARRWPPGSPASTARAPWDPAHAWPTGHAQGKNSPRALPTRGGSMGRSWVDQPAQYQTYGRCVRSDARIRPHV